MSLFDLVSDLEVDGTPSAAWVASNDLPTLWQGDEAPWMAQLVSRVAARHSLVAAACAIGRRVERLLPAGDPRALRALERAEAWLRDPSIDLAAVADGGYIAEVDAHAAGFAAQSAVQVAFDAARVAIGEVDLARVVTHADNAIRNGEGIERPQLQRELAVIIRAHLPCPTLEALVAAYR